MHRSVEPLSSQKKAKCHRRRYAPVGPAGVLFQAQREQRSVKNGLLVSSSMNEEVHEEETGIEFTQDIAENTKAPTDGVVFYSRAWVDMLCQLNIVTPMLRAYLSEEQRYMAIRRFMPRKFTMIREILQGQADWKLSPGKSLLVLVHAIDSRSDNLWVAELLDETGSKISAWIKPRFVQQEQKLPKYVRTGMVWMLKDVTILLDSSLACVDDKTNSEANEYRRMLLVGEQNIESVWAPPSIDDDADTSNPRFIDWMEKRNTLTSSLDISAEPCDINSVCESEEACPIESIDRMNTVQEENSLPPISVVDRSSSAREHQTISIHSDDISAPALENLFGGEQAPKLPDIDQTQAVTPLGDHTILPESADCHQLNCNNSSGSPFPTRKRKDTGDQVSTVGLWSAYQGDGVAAFSFDDEADEELWEAGPSTSCSAAPLPSSSPGIPPQRSEQASIFQSSDFVSLELDCSSDDG